MFLTVQVRILNQQLLIQVNPTETFQAQTEKILNQLEIIRIVDQNKINIKIYVDDIQVDLNSNFKKENVNENSIITVVLTKPFEITFKHEFFDEFKFKANYFGSIDSFIRYVNKMINKNNKQITLESKLIMEGQQLSRDAFWCFLGQENELKFQIVIESSIDLIYNNRRQTFTLNICWDSKQIISLAQKYFLIEDAVLLQMNQKEINPTQSIYSLLQQRNNILTLSSPQIIKYFIKNEKNEILEILIDKDQLLSDLEFKCAEMLRMPITQTVCLQYDDFALDSKKTIKQNQIPYNTILKYEVIKQEILKLNLQNITNLRLLTIDVTPRCLLRNIDDFIPGQKKDVQYFLNGELLMDKSLTIEQINLMRNQVFGYQVIEDKGLQIIFLNNSTNTEQKVLVFKSNLISDQFKEIIAKETFTLVTDYKIIYNSIILNINQTFEKAHIKDQSVLIYSCTQRKIKVSYKSKIFEMNVSRSIKLGDLEVELKKKLNISPQYTIFEIKQDSFAKKTVEQLGENEILQFFEKQPKKKSNDADFYAIIKEQAGSGQISNQLYLPPTEASQKLLSKQIYKSLGLPLYKKVRIIISGKTLNFEIDSKATIQEITEQIQATIAHKIKGDLSHFGLSYNGHILQSETAIGSLSTSEVIELYYQDLRKSVSFH